MNWLRALTQSMQRFGIDWRWKVREIYSKNRRTLKAVKQRNRAKYLYYRNNQRQRELSLMATYHSPYLDFSNDPF